MHFIKNRLTNRNKILRGNDMEKKTAYCPICDKGIVITTNSSIIHCPDCGHHINLHPIDRYTALEILKEFSRDMYPSYDLFGKKTLVINRDKFEAIRAKYLG